MKWAVFQTWWCESLLPIIKCLQQISQRKKEKLGCLKEESRLERQKERQEPLGRYKGSQRWGQRKARGLCWGREQPGLDWGDKACRKISCEGAVSPGPGGVGFLQTGCTMSPVLPAYCVNTLAESLWAKNTRYPSVPHCAVVCLPTSQICPCQIIPTIPLPYVHCPKRGRCEKLPPPQDRGYEK